MVTISIITIFFYVAVGIVATYLITKSIYQANIKELQEVHGAALNALASDRDDYRAKHTKTVYELNKVHEEKRIIEERREELATQLSAEKRSKTTIEGELAIVRKERTTLEVAKDTLEGKVKNLDDKLAKAIERDMESREKAAELSKQLDSKSIKVDALEMALKESNDINSAFLVTEKAITKELEETKSSLGTKIDILSKEVEEARESQLESEDIAINSAKLNVIYRNEQKDIRTALGFAEDEEPVQPLAGIITERIDKLKQVESLYYTAKYFNMVFITLLNATIKEFPSSLALRVRDIYTYPNLKLTRKDDKYEVTNSTNRTNLTNKIVFTATVGEKEINATEVFNQITTGTFDTNTIPSMEELEANLVKLFGNI